MTDTNLATERATFSGPFGEIEAFVARPTQGSPWPGILMIHDRYGLYEQMEQRAGELAVDGYLVLIPNLYSRDTVRRSLRTEDLLAAARLLDVDDLEAALQQVPPELRDRVRSGVSWFRSRDNSTHMVDLDASLEYLKSRADVRPDAVASLGYCMGGGRSAQLAASGAELAAAVIYYGSFAPLDHVPNIRCPVLGHYGTLDHSITDRVPEVAAAMRTHGKTYDWYVYDDAPHAFANHMQASYRPEAARVALERTRAFLARHLNEVPAPVGRG